MIIGGKEFNIGDHIRVISAKSVLHYDYGMIGNEYSELNGVTGIIIATSTYDENAVCNLKIDKPYADAYKNGITRLYKDDEIELICG